MSEEKKRYMYEMWVDDNKVFQRQPEGIVRVNDFSENTFSQPPYTDEEYKKFQQIAYPNTTKEQMETNQKIVDKMIFIINTDIHYAGVISEDAYKELITIDHQIRSTLKKIIKDATGKDIKDL